MTTLLVGFDSAWTSTNSGALVEENTVMNGRKLIRDAIIRKKILHWRNAARSPNFYKNIYPSRARKNFWRLIGRYPEIATQLGVHEASVYD